MYHELTVIGNIGKNDAELRFTPSGQPVSNFSVAANRTYKDSNGDKVQETTWFKCTLWGKLAESLTQYLTSGKLIMVKGRLTPDKKTGGPRIWEKKDGSGYGASFEMTITEIKLLPSGNGNGGSGKQRASREDEDVPGGEAATSVDGWDDDEEIPL